jgi:hypothetical protein
MSDGTASSCAALTPAQCSWYAKSMASSRDTDHDDPEPAGDERQAAVEGAPAEPHSLERLALALVETCVRNTQLEDLHAGVVPRSAVGDFSDVTVVTPYGDIPWGNLSRISDPEMKALMTEIVDRVFTFLQYPEDLTKLGGAARWDRPKLDAALMRTVRRRRGDTVPFPEPRTCPLTLASSIR